MLTPSQRDAISQFQRVIPNPQLSESQQIQLLQSFNWDLERSILYYYESHPYLAVASAPTNTTGATRSRSRSSLISDAMSDNPFARLLRGVGVGSSSDNNSSNIIHDSTQSMPGAFPEDEIIREPSKLHQYFNKFINYSLQFIVNAIVLPLCVIYKALGYTLAFLLAIVMPIIGHNGLKYKIIRKTNNPTDVARRFVMRFDETIGNSTYSSGRLDTIGSNLQVAVNVVVEATVKKLII
ncbi:unnamed protein product [Ambrosiozyma monospora]|uniref:Unnamed protein product n=1 Tax=Ambrosiozyma monospora TaxID=43982 RepID=A0ACB5STT8_AMBMO|nr:unnamed protein product [Ambrosiozyma monospora]